MIKSSRARRLSYSGCWRKRGMAMPGKRRWIAFGLFWVAPLLLVRTLLAQTAVPASESSTPHHHKSHAAPKPVELPQLPAGPLSQLPMDQIPPSPAKVSYQGGLLTIAAQNSI